jgi:hypothetical protein
MAWAVLGMGSAPIKNPHPTELSEPEALALIRHLAIPGSAARWSARFTPYLAADASTGTCAPSSWAQVRMGQRQALRTGYAAVLRERIAASAPAVKVSPPPIDKDDIGHNEAPVAGGCLLCGIKQQTLPAKAVEQLGGRSSSASQIWAMWKITPEQMGGKARPVTLVGFLCKIYSAAVTQVGALGPTALERALVAHIAPISSGCLATTRWPSRPGGLGSGRSSRQPDRPIGEAVLPSRHPGVPSKLRSALGG